MFATAQSFETARSYNAADASFPGASMTRLMKTLTEELTAWRATLETMKGTNVAEVDDVIAHIEASIKSVAALREADRIDKVDR